MVTDDSCSSEPAANPKGSPAGNGTSISTRVVADATGLAPLRSWLSDRLASHLDDDALQLYLVAVTEAATNAIAANGRMADDRPIVVTIDDESGCVTVEDHGGGIRATAAEETSVPSPSARRGRGLVIIRSICPTVRFETTNAGTRVELPFRT